MKRLFALLLILAALVPAFSSVAESDPVSALPSPAPVVLDEKAEKRIDQYMKEFDLSEECKAVIVEYLPDVNQFDWMKQEGLAAYAIYLTDGMKYYLNVTKDKQPMILQSAEEDYKLRTRFYDRFAN